MSKAAVEKAIEAHESWVEAFRRWVFLGEEGGFNPELVGAEAERECELGQMLVREPALFDNPVSHNTINALHGTFHGAARQVVALMQQPKSEAAVAAAVHELERISVQLIRLMRQAHTSGEDGGETPASRART